MDCPPVAAGAVLYVVMPMFLLFGSVTRTQLADVPDLVTLCNCRFFPGLMFLIGKGLLPSLFITYAFFQRMAVIGGKRVFSVFVSFQVQTVGCCRFPARLVSKSC